MDKLTVFRKNPKTNKHINKKDTSRQDRHEIFSMACHIMPYFLEINAKFEVGKITPDHDKAISNTIMFIDNFRGALDSYVKRPNQK